MIAGGLMLLPLPRGERVGVRGLRPRGRIPLTPLSPLWGLLQKWGVL